MARVEPIHYKGKVWCVRVPSGAFVARRNGKVFVTGNSGFPKSLDVGKAIDKAAGVEREVVGFDSDKAARFEKGLASQNTGWDRPWMHEPDAIERKGNITAPATDAARQWNGWGTALKPAMEMITMARKPFPGTVAANVLQWGTGGLNVDGCRVGTSPADAKAMERANSPLSGRMKAGATPIGTFERSTPSGAMDTTSGRWPANLVHDGSEEVVELFPNVGKAGKHGGGQGGFNSHGGHNCYRKGDESFDASGGYADSGSAARFFKCCPETATRFRYAAKASKADRDEGCEGMEERKVSTMNGYARPSEGRTADKNGGPKRNHHPTVKPTDLMRYLCRLVTPPGGIVLDPFMGSGSTGRGAILEGFNFVGIELDPDYFDIAVKRIEASLAKEQEAPVVQKTLFE